MKAIISFIILIIIFSCSGNKKKQLSKEQLIVLDSLALVKKEKQSILDSLGIWEIRTTLDEFGEPTYAKYITTTLFGTFSNSATQDSELRIEFRNSAFRLFKYNGNNPVKGNSNDEFIVLIQDKDGIRYKLSASIHSRGFIRMHTTKQINYNGNIINFSDCLSSIIAKGGEIKFIVREVDDLNTEYKFTIPNANGYKFAVNSDDFRKQFDSEGYRKMWEEFEKETKRMIKEIESQYR